MKQTKQRACASGLRLAGAALLAAFVTMPAGAQELCADLRAAFAASVPNGTLPVIIAAGRKILDGNACDAATRRGIGRAIAMVHVRESEKISDAAARLKLLEGGMQFAQHWRLMSEIGALREKVPDASGRPNRSGASLAYQAALADISNKVDVPNSAAAGRDPEAGPAGAADPHAVGHLPAWRRADDAGRTRCRGRGGGRAGSRYCVQQR